MPPLDVPDSITDKLLLVFSPFDPVKGDATVKPTVDTFEWISLYLVKPWMVDA